MNRAASTWRNAPMCRGKVPSPTITWHFDAGIGSMFQERNKNYSYPGHRDTAPRSHPSQPDDSALASLAHALIKRAPDIRRPFALHSALLADPAVFTVTSAAQNSGVGTNLDSVVAALADLSDGELDALIATVNDCPQFAPGFLAWIEHVCDWEQNRRRGLDFPPQPPEAAIEPSEDAASIGGALLLRASLATDGQAVTVLFDAIVALLTGKGRRK